MLRNEEPARFTRSANRGWRGPAGRSSCSSTATPRSTPGGLARLVAAFARDPSLGIAGALLHYPDGSPQWSGGREPSLAWFFALASGLPALLARLPFYRRAKPLDADRPGAVDWVTGAAMAFRRAGLGGGGAARRGVPLLRPGPRLLPARPAGPAGGWRCGRTFRVLHHHGATIGRDPGARGRQHPELLWSDLLRWARKHRGNPGRAGPPWRSRRGAWPASSAGQLLSALLFLPPARRQARRAETRAFRRAFRLTLCAVLSA